MCVKGNKKDGCCYVSNKRANKENVGPLPKGLGDLVTTDTGGAELPRPLCLVKGLKGEKKDQQWMRVESGITCENSTHTSPCVPIGHSHCPENWLMSLQRHSL